MGLINILLGAKKAARTIAEIEAALARLVSERNIAKEAIASAMHARDSLLLEDESDSRISKIDASTDKGRLKVERCDKLEPILLQELATAKGAAHTARWGDISERFDARAALFVGKAREALAALEGMARIRGEAQSTGFASEASALAVAPNILAADLIAAFEFAVERQREAAVHRPAPAPKPVAPPPPEQPAKPILAKAAAPPAAPVAPPPAKPFTPPEPAPDGSARVVFLKAGYELPDGTRPKVSDTLDLPADVALDVVRATVAEYAQSLEAVR